MDDKDFKEEYELKDKTCGALLLQFREPKVYDLAIPCAYHIKALVAISGRIMKGEEINPLDVDCITSNPERNNLQRLKKEYFSEISPRVSEGLMKILEDSREEDSFLSFYMGNSPETLAHEWHMGKGDWYRFREGKREEITEEVLKYFNSSEFADFYKIKVLFRPYIERVGADHISKK